MRRMHRLMNPGRACPDEPNPVDRSIVKGVRWAALVAVVLGAAVLGAAACTPRVDVRGYVPDPERVAEIAPGIDSREDVAEMLGSPSGAATFDGRTWYYISRRTEGIAFLEDEVIDQQVVAVVFDKDWIVSEIRHYGIEDGRIIDLVTRTTATRGNELGFLEQLFGNIGRFNAPAGAEGN